MNEQIKELAEEAGFRYIKDEGIGWAGNHNSSLPRFAELIVRECSRIADDWVNDKDDGKNYPSDVIKKHFGVQ